jgi:hypothetical protein
MQETKEQREAETQKDAERNRVRMLMDIAQDNYMRSCQTGEEGHIVVAENLEIRNRKRAPAVSNTEATITKKQRICQTRKSQHDKKQSYYQNKKQNRADVKKAQLENRLHFLSTKVNSETNTNDFEKYPETAVIQWLLNTGREQFRGIEDLLPGQNIPDYLIKEIQEEKLTPTEEDDILCRYYRSQGRGIFEDNPNEWRSEENHLPHSIDAYIISCGCCGIRTVDRDMKRSPVLVDIRDLDPLLVYNEKQLEIHEQQKLEPLLAIPVQLSTDGHFEFRYIAWYKIKSFYESRISEKKVFHLHPELVHYKDGKEFTYLCFEFARNLKKTNH